MFWKVCGSWYILCLFLTLFMLASPPSGYFYCLYLLLCHQDCISSYCAYLAHAICLWSGMCLVGHLQWPLLNFSNYSCIVLWLMAVLSARHKTSGPRQGLWGTKTATNTKTLVCRDWNQDKDPQDTKTETKTKTLDCQDWDPDKYRSIASPRQPICL